MELFAMAAMIHSIALLAILVYKKRTIRSAYITFLAIAVAFYLIGNYIEISNYSIDAANVGLMVRFLAIPFIPTLWYFSVREFCGLHFKKDVSVILLLIAPTLVALLALTWESNGLLFTNADYLNDNNKGNLVITGGPLYAYYIFYEMLINLAGVYTLIKTYREGSKRVKKQALLFFTSTLLPFFTVATYIVPIGGYNVDITPYGLLLSLTLFVIALYRFGVLNLSHVIKEKAIDHIQEGLILFDHEGLYLESNTSAQRIIPAIARMKIGGNLVEAEGLPFGPSIFELSDQGEEPIHEFSVERDGESKTYSVSISRIYHDKKIIGYSVILNNITLLKSILTNFKEKSITDPLTGIYNRAFLFEKGENVFDNYKFSADPFCVIMLDIDHFKSVNDTFGHVFGDYVLQTLSSLCTAYLRKSDLVARYGGEEFCILLFSSTPEIAYSKAELLRQKISEYSFESDGLSTKVTSSFGVACINEKDQAFLDIIKRADENLYQAKANGRNRVC